MATTTVNRFLAIDVLRATTMFFMIFVNDIWTLSNIPSWIGHVAADVDGMGFSDIIFPLFLYIVGLSIPYAIANKIAKGASTYAVLMHIATRTIALLVMGVFLVNAENYNEGAYLHKSWWVCLLILSFFLLWRVYPKNMKHIFWYRIAGVVLLLGLAFIFERNDGARGIPAMGVYWWGILGLIGWGYLCAGLVYLFFYRHTWVLVVSTLLFFGFTVAGEYDFWAQFGALRPYLWLAENSTMAAFCMLGVLSTVAYNKLKDKPLAFYAGGTAVAVVLLVAGMLTRPIWGISKIHATPSWLMLCGGIGILLFLVTVYLTKGKTHIGWYNSIRAAASSTLTCYLVPYVFYALLAPVYTQLPAFMTTGVVGIVKSLLFAWLIIQITAQMEKRSWKLKI
ncbi:DUF5009 domain-containing protein [Sphingobacterium psychroaquaticum]|uniref:DUF5009 domain-containing protein n=1 Tax=Sphingobacterium psychroaquaticum TaxID=561061 RepID=UPI0010691E93|nr:DUF5009 domain-containing protein [Sphingobacterium psychroaquaticum]QBQ40623.1 DUF5009 domain-containing protein [Sphingobacterium psychroaquaticum]